MMDSVYAPRPYTRTPRGYRSIGGPMRSFGSMTALNNEEAHAPLTVRQMAPQSRYSFACVNEPVYHNDPSYNTFRPIHQTGRTASAAQLPSDQYSVDSTFSSRASSPMNRYPPPSYHPQQQRNLCSPSTPKPYNYGQDNRFGYGTLPHSNNNYYEPPSMSTSMRSDDDDFLHRLRNQKDQIERQMAAPPYFDSYSATEVPMMGNGTLPRNTSFRPFHDNANVQQKDSWNQPTPINSESTLEAAYNRALHKTRSDSHLLNDSIRPMIERVPEPRKNYGFIQSQNRPQSVMMSSLTEAPKRGFFATGNLLERAVNNTDTGRFNRPVSNNMEWNDDQNIWNEHRNSRLFADSQPSQERIIPIQIGNDRVLKIDSDDLIKYTPVSHAGPPPPPAPVRVQEHSTLRSPPISYFANGVPPPPPQRTIFSPVQANTFYPRAQTSTFSAPPLTHAVSPQLPSPDSYEPNDYLQIRNPERLQNPHYQPPPYVHPSQQSNYQSPILSSPTYSQSSITNKEHTYQQPFQQSHIPIPPPPPPPVPISPPLNQQPFLNRMVKTQNAQPAPTSPPEAYSRERSKTPTKEHPLIPSALHQEILNVIPNRQHRQPPPHQNRPQFKNEDGPIACGPVGAKVFSGETPRSSIIELGTVTELGYVNGEDKRASYVEPFMSSSYPAPSNIGQKSFAVVSRPMSPTAMIVQPVLPQPMVREDPTPPLSPEAPIDPNPCASPALSDERVMSPSHVPPSPIGSVYDNATDDENLKLGMRPQPQRYKSPPPPPHGILVRKEEANGQQKAQKKVVFQVDEDTDDESYKKPQLGWADLGLAIYECCTPCPTISRAGAVAPSAGGSGEVPAHVRDYDDGMFDVLSRFGALSDKIGGDCGTAGKQVTEIFSELRTLLWTAAGQAEPNATALQKLIEPMGKKLGSLNDFRESKRNTPHFNHLSAVAEGIQAVGWVAVKPTPAPFVKDMLESSMFFVNRVLKDHKDGDATHTEWAKCWIEVMNTLQTFVRKTHTTGLVWNSAPGSAPPSKGGASVAPVTPSAGGPPPPPPPPPADFLGTPSKGDSDKAARNELFKELNQGENITSKLKKVTSDMQTHKNPNLRASAVVPATAATGASVSAPAKAAPAAQKPPKIELENGKQWIVENFKNDKNVVVEVTDKKQTVYIYKCEGSVIRINGKANSITMDQCKKTAIAFDGIVAQIETINCQSVEIQTLGDMPTLSIQKTDGCQVYLSEAALGSEIVTSKSSEMNVHIPKKDGDFVELALPEQFKTVYKNGKLETTISDI